jgi:hypothetical protein
METVSWKDRNFKKGIHSMVRIAGMAGETSSS